MANQSNNSYTDKIYLATAEVADKAITAKNAVASKLGYSEKGENENETTSGEKEKASNQQSSSYTEKLSSAKNTVASKLGFGEKNERGDSNVTSHEEKNIENVSSATSAPGSTAEYRKRIADSLTEKLALVYGKVAGVGSAVKSKVPGTESKSEVLEQDKGVSMNNYLAEKLRPGEDDRALSEVISGSLYKKGSDDDDNSVEVYDEGKGKGVKKVVSDVVHKRGDDERREVPRGKVIESEAVKRRLGSWDDAEREKGDGESPGKAVVDKIKGWLDLGLGVQGRIKFNPHKGVEICLGILWWRLKSLIKV